MIGVRDRSEGLVRDEPCRKFDNGQVLRAQLRPRRQIPVGDDDGGSALIRGEDPDDERTCTREADGGDDPLWFDP